MNEVASLLPWLNVLILPAIGYIIKLERRILTLEITIQHALKLRGLGDMPVNKSA